MRSFSEYNPIVIAVFFFSVAGVVMFSVNPAFSSVSLAGAVLLFTVMNGRKRLKLHLWLFTLFVILALANPLVSHNGRTVLFVLNDNPVTLEALLYGVNSAAMLVGTIYWFSSFTHIMTAEKLLYITGAFSPKISLVLSMALRFVPMFRTQAKKVSDAQKAMGLFKEDSIIDDIRGYMRIFSILITWALENGITTADSMTARGYGIGRRTVFSRFRFTAADIVFLAVNIILLGVCSFGGMNMHFSFYPDITLSAEKIPAIAGTSAYILLVLMPVIIETEVTVKWKYLQSKI